MIQSNRRDPIYKPTHTSQAAVNKLKPLFESAFGDAMGRFSGSDSRSAIKKERVEFAARQYANRARVAENMGQSPLYEDSQIFKNFGPAVVNLFESNSTPQNIAGIGNIVNPGSPTTTPGGIWNPNYQAGSGDIPSYVFGLQSQVALYCEGFDLLPTISVDTPKIVLNFVDTVYGGGDLDGVEDFPSIIEVASKLFTHAKIKELKLKRAKSKVVIWDGKTNGGLALEVLFLTKSLERPAINVEVLNFGTSDDGIAITKDATTSAVTVVNSINAGLAASKLFVDGADSGVTVTDADTVKLSFVSSTRTNIAEAATNDNSQGGMSREQHRQGAKHKLNIITMDKEVHIGGIEIDADTDNIQIKDLAAQGVSVIARLYAGVQNQLIQTIDEYITTHLYRLGVQHAVSAYETQGINHSLYIASPSVDNINPADLDIIFDDATGNDASDKIGLITNSIKSSAYENQMTHADRLFARILKIAEFVGQVNRIGAPDWALVSGEIAATIKKHSTFTASPIASTLSGKAEVHYSGTIFETISLYKNPRIDFNDPRILLGRRGDDTDPGAKFLAYDLAASRQTIAEGTMAEKIRAWSRFEIADIGFYPELNYYTMIAINEFDWS